MATRQGMSPSSTGAKTFMVFGALSVAAFLIVWVFIGQLFRDTFPNAGSKEIQENITENGNSSQENEDQDTTADTSSTIRSAEELYGGLPKPLDTDPQRGASQPVVTIIEFGDFQCEHCADMAPILDQLVQEFPNDVLHVWKDFPIPALHPYAEIAAQAARCAQDQDRFWEYHDVLLERQGTFPLTPWYDIADEVGLDAEQFEQCLTSNTYERLVVSGFMVARTLDIETAPSYYINDRLLTGPQTYESLQELVTSEIQSAVEDGV